ncbi:UMP kinase [Candidatus Parcubacteria bacterium]|nr:UMP kinase [Candidatus Parcubacteria bacterium]
MQKNKTFIISLGGSLIVTNKGINCSYLKNFKKLILSQLKKGNKFFIIAGGGITARNYIVAADKITNVTDDDRDWLGIHSTRLNAHLIKMIFKKEAHREIIKNPTYQMSTNKKIIISGGWKPGWSTDYVATMIAQEYEIPTIINLSNIDYAYDKDPNKFKDAKKITDTTWKDFRKIVGNKWVPGLNAPFDPIASRKGSQLKLKVIITNGKKLKNLEKIFNNEKYSGTTIK